MLHFINLSWGKCNITLAQIIVLCMHLHTVLSVLWSFGLTWPHNRFYSTYEYIYSSVSSRRMKQLGFCTYFKSCCISEKKNSKRRRTTKKLKVLKLEKIFIRSTNRTFHEALYKNVLLVCSSLTHWQGTHVRIILYTRKKTT